MDKKVRHIDNYIFKHLEKNKKDLYDEFFSNKPIKKVIDMTIRSIWKDSLRINLKVCCFLDCLKQYLLESNNFTKEDRKNILNYNQTLQKIGDILDKINNIV